MKNLILPLLAMVWLAIPSQCWKSDHVRLLQTSRHLRQLHNTSFDLTYVEIDVANKIYQLKVVATYDPISAGLRH